MYSGDKDKQCGKCGKRTRWVRCPRSVGCDGKGNTWSTRCGNNCEDGYKCGNAPTDKYHS